MIDRVPPQNIEAEQAVLGAMLLEREAIAKVMEKLRSEDFYREAHKVIFNAMRRIRLFLTSCWNFITAMKQSIW